MKRKLKVYIEHDLKLSFFIRGYQAGRPIVSNLFSVYSSHVLIKYGTYVRMDKRWMDKRARARARERERETNKLLGKFAGRGQLLHVVTSSPVW